MESIIIHTTSKEQVSVFEQMAKALKVPFEISSGKKVDKVTYSKKFNEKIRQAKEDVKKGHVRAFTPEDFEL